MPPAFGRVAAYLNISLIACFARNPGRGVRGYILIIGLFNCEQIRSLLEHQRNATAFRIFLSN